MDGGPILCKTCCETWSCGIHCRGKTPRNSRPPILRIDSIERDMLNLFFYTNCFYELYYYLHCSIL